MTTRPKFIQSLPAVGMAFAVAGGNLVLDESPVFVSSGGVQPALRVDGSNGNAGRLSGSNLRGAGRALQM